MNDQEDSQDLQYQLEQLRLEHSDLDEVIDRLNHDPMMDQLRLKRLKARKLKLKDLIARVESRLIPDLNA